MMSKEGDEAKLKGKKVTNSRSRKRIQKKVADLGAAPSE